MPLTSEDTAAGSAQPPPSSTATYLAGMRAALTSVFSLVLVGTYVGIGALAHDYGFSLVWVMLSTVLLWAGPAQVIMISALGTGGALIEVALAIGLSGVRFLPMVVSLLPLMRGPRTRTARSAGAGAFHRRQRRGSNPFAAAAIAARAAHSRSATAWPWAS